MEAMGVDDRITCLHDISPADWIGPRLHPFTVDTGSVIPEGYEACFRIFRPVKPQWPETRIRTWAEVATEHDRIAQPEMQFHMINRTVDSHSVIVNGNEGVRNTRRSSRFSVILRAHSPGGTA